MALQAVLLVKTSPNFVGALPEPTPRDPDLIQLNWSIFTEKFIFVHFGHCRNNTHPGTLKTLKPDSIQLYHSNATIFIEFEGQ